MNTRNAKTRRESTVSTPVRRNTTRTRRSKPPSVINVRHDDSSSDDKDPETEHPSPQESPTKKQKTQFEDVTEEELLQDRNRFRDHLYDEFGQEGVDEYNRLLYNSEDLNQAIGSVTGDQALGSIAVDPPTEGINLATSRDETLTSHSHSYMDMSFDESHKNRWGNDGMQKEPPGGRIPEDPDDAAWFEIVDNDDDDSAFNFDLRNTRSYMVQVAKSSKLLKKKPANISDKVWRNKSLRQRIAMVAKNIGLKLDEIDQLSDVREFVDDLKVYREEKELKDSDFNKLQEMARSFRSGTLSDESKKIYERHIDKYREFMKYYKLSPMEKSTLETYIVAMHHVYSGSTMWSVMSCLNYYYKLYHDHDTKKWPSIRQIMKAVTNNHVVRKAAIFEEEDILEIFRRLRVKIDIVPKTAKETRERHNALTHYIGIHMFHYGMCRKSDIMRTDHDDVERLNVKDHEFYQVKLLPKPDDVLPEDGVQMGAGRMASGTNKRKNLLPLIYNLPEYLTPFMDEYVKKRSKNPKCKPRFLKNASPGMKNTEVYFTNCGPTNIGGWAKYWAEELGKKNYNDFSSHSWRRTAATCMVDNGGTLPPSETPRENIPRQLQTTPAESRRENLPPTTTIPSLPTTTQTLSPAPSPVMQVQQQQAPPTLQQPYNPYKSRYSQQMPVGMMTPQQQQMPMGMMTPQQQQMPMGMMTPQQETAAAQVSGQSNPMAMQQQMMPQQMMGMMMSPQQLIMMNQQMVMSMLMNQQGGGNTIHGSNNSIVVHKQ